MRIVEHFFRVLAPANCLQCGDEGSLICGWCLESALPEVVPRCYRCNKLSSNSAICVACRRHTATSHLWIRTEFSQIARKLVHTMKFKYSGEAADLIAAELLNTLPALSPDTIIVCVPTATNHMRQRGMDHTKRIAQELSRLSGLRHLPALARSGQLRQVGSNRRQRLTQMEGAFRVRTGISLESERVLLIDDVLTTGTTIETAAKILKEAGAKSVDAVVFAAAK